MPEPQVVRLGPGTDVTVFVTGWIAVRRAHRRFGGPDALAFPAVLLDRTWTGWMPIHAFLVRHPEGLLLVDTGDAEDRPPGWFGCGSAGQETFCRRYLRLAVPDGAALPHQLRAVAVDRHEIDTVVITHLHTDHTGTLGHFTRSRVLVGDGGTGPYRGSTHCRLPDGDRLRSARWTDGPVLAFPRSLALTVDGTVRSVPLPGHTPGHQGLVVTGEAATVVVAGDAAFGIDQVRTGPPPGIAADRPANRDTQAALARAHADGAMLLFSHAPPAGPGGT